MNRTTAQISHMGPHGVVGWLCPCGVARSTSPSEPMNAAVVGNWVSRLPSLASRRTQYWAVSPCNLTYFAPESGRRSPGQISQPRHAGGSQRIRGTGVALTTGVSNYPLGEPSCYGCGQAVTSRTTKAEHWAHAAKPGSPADAPPSKLHALPTPDTRALDTEMKRCYALGLIRYPSILWSLPAFERAWRAYSSDENSDESVQANEANYVRLACLARRPGAVEILEREFVQPLSTVVLAVCKDQDLTEEALQLLREKLLVSGKPKLASYRRSGNFRAWLRVVATRTALDCLRSRAALAAHPIEPSEPLAEIATGPEGHFLREEFRGVFGDALQAAVGSLPKRQWRVLRMHLVFHWNVTQIGRVFSIHRATAARWLVAARENLEQALHDELSQRLDSDREDVALVLGEMRSRLEVRVSQLFSATGVAAPSGITSALDCGEAPSTGLCGT